MRVGIINQSRYWSIIQWGNIRCLVASTDDVFVIYKNVQVRLNHLEGSYNHIQVCVCVCACAFSLMTHWCTCLQVGPCLHDNSRCGSCRAWRPRWWSDCWADTADIIRPPGRTWRCLEGKLKTWRESKKSVKTRFALRLHLRHFHPYTRFISISNACMHQLKANHSLRPEAFRPDELLNVLSPIFPTLFISGWKVNNLLFFSLSDKKTQGVWTF